MRLNTYQKLAVTTVLATLFLIMVGGLVRAAGAGLGCPDWPQCWGTWLPPLDPATIDGQRYDISQFNATKMWVEYINRLIGVTIGLLILATFMASLRYLRSRPVITAGSFLSLLLVIFQAWLGGVVVRSGLQGMMISLHLLMAILLVFVLLYTTFRATRDKLHIDLSLSWRRRLLMVCIGLLAVTLAQMVLGAQVREALDGIAHTAPVPERAQWIHQVGFMDHVHRAGSWLVLLLSLMLWWGGRQAGARGLIQFAIRGNGLLCLGQVAVGITLAYAALPPAAQVAHLFLASLLVCHQLLLILMLGHAGRETNPLHEPGSHGWTATGTTP